jgi:DMSO/TMAO reductase YedYZ heme-binding membrane subunit
MYSLLISLGVTAWLRLQISSDQLYYIRLEQVFGFIGLAFLYIALIISPLSLLFKQNQGVKYMLFARRAIGVSAAYFAVLHASVALWG